MEASTGIEPVYTDLQSPILFNDNNHLNDFWYQDISRTQEERDTREVCAPEKGRLQLIGQLSHRSFRQKKKVAGRVAALSDDTKKLIASSEYQKPQNLASSGQEVRS
ncbi:MAG: hypothetical protein CSA68_12585 [Rhodobacterales bacterium]|nr:MAG: hypothetical protein CSA68_12585 [Rhodobacterales bacterium]